MIYGFENNQEQEFLQCIKDNPGCYPRRLPDRLEVLTGDDIPPLETGDEQSAQ